MSKAVTIEKDVGKLLLYLLGSALFVSISLYMINGGFTSSHRSPTVFEFIMGIIGILLFGTTGISSLLGLFIFKSALIFNEKGIINRTHIGGGYLIEWKNIKSMKIDSFSNKKFIAIHLQDNEQVLRQINPISRFIMKLNAPFLGTPVFISSAVAQGKLETILQIIRQQKQEFKKKALDESTGK